MVYQRRDSNIYLRAPMPTPPTARPRVKEGIELANAWNIDPKQNKTFFYVRRIYFNWESTDEPHAQHIDPLRESRSTRIPAISVPNKAPNSSTAAHIQPLVGFAFRAKNNVPTYSSALFARV